MTGAFSPDYDTARSRFLVAARARGAELASIPIAAPGPSGTPLTIDSATLGPQDAPRKVVVSSGLHGVEGFAGSAIQLAWLERPSRPPAPDVAIVLVHALNPYGFAWIRRTNERNVDLNRNFFSDRSFLGSDDVRRAEAIYRRFSPFLNPTSTPSRWEPYTLRALLAIARHGRRALERALPVGQYIEARGLFFGGHDTETTTARPRA